MAVSLEGGTAGDTALSDAIPKRQSTRVEFDGRQVSNADLQTLSDAAVVPGVDVVLITDRLRMDRLRELVVEGNTAQMTDPAFMRELITGCASICGRPWRLSALMLLQPAAFKVASWIAVL